MVHYLVAVDRSEASIRALHKALSLLNKERDKITAVHAFDLPVNSIQAAAVIDPLGGERLIDPAAELESHRAISRELMQQVNEICGQVQHECIVEYGAPVAVLKKKVEELHPDVLVLGTRGLNAVQRFLLGSVSNEFTHNPPCPVLLVP